ncbi:MAG: SDR family NAD(P)-dependent oxidoreductase, partial [Pseudolabrys sp.]|nr:SDR family NAD(P)-dependent oxidoreductase [Pseudolabrys sp.]
MRLQGKIAIVTGAGSGMGAAIAKTYAREGAHVTVADIDGGAAKKVADQIGRAAMAVKCDVTKRRDIDAVVVETASKFGGLNILVNNAGVAHVNKPLLEIDEKEFERVFAVNVKGLFMFTQAVVPLMKGKGGVIINIGST